MIDHRVAIRIALTALLAAWLAAAPARAQDFHKFIPFLVDLSGWTGGQAEGATMQLPAATLIGARREYKRGYATLEAGIVSGQGAPKGASEPGINLVTAEVHVISSVVDGFVAFRTFHVKEKSGSILVALGPSGTFALNFEGVPEDEALPLARRFDWKAIAAALPK